MQSLDHPDLPLHTNVRGGMDNYNRNPTLKALIWIWYCASQMTEPKIAEFLPHLGLQISEGQITPQEERHAEKDTIAESAIVSLFWQQADDTVTRIKGRIITAL